MLRPLLLAGLPLLARTVLGAVADISTEEENYGCPAVAGTDDHVDFAGLAPIAGQETEQSRPFTPGHGLQDGQALINAPTDSVADVNPEVDALSGVEKQESGPVEGADRRVDAPSIEYQGSDLVESGEKRVNAPGIEHQTDDAVESGQTRVEVNGTLRVGNGAHRHEHARIPAASHGHDHGHGHGNTHGDSLSRAVLDAHAGGGGHRAVVAATTTIKPPKPKDTILSRPVASKDAPKDTMSSKFRAPERTSLGKPPAFKVARPTTKPSTSPATTATHVSSDLPGSADIRPSRPAASPTTRAAYKSTTAQYTPSPVPSSQNSTGRLRNGLYFTNWGIYSAGFQPYQIPADRITHLFYAFALADENGTVISSDPYADLNKMYTGDTREEGPNAYGCIKQLYIKKKHNRHLKTVLSIGGYNFSLKGNFARLAATAAGRRNFCTSAVELMRDWGMDGLDIDWEYPNDDTEATNLILLLQECREALDRLATTQEQRYHYLLTAATSAGPEKYGKMNLTAMDPLLDSWNLMAYDFAGSWDSTTGHQANVYPDRNNMVSTKFHTDKAVTDYMAAHIPPEKITLGLPLYGRSFAQTQGLGRSYSGTGAKPEREGTWRYHELPRPGAKAEFDDRIGAAWSYSRTTGELVTHDTLDSTQFKARYIRSKGLGGAFFWEAAGDKKGEDSLVSAMARALTPLDDSPNMLSYPDSRYLNIRNNMPGA